MNYKNYLTTLKSMALAKFGVKTPIKVSHFVTNRCNLNCCFCLAKDLKRDSEMTTEEIKKAMNEFKRAGTQLWDFCGGEPLLRKDISELILYAKEIGLMVSIVTNGMQIKKNILALLKADSIMISIDGPKEIHDKIRGAPCFDTIVENLDILVKNNKTPIINMVISRDNLTSVDYMINFAKQHHCLIDFSLVVANRFEIGQYTLSKEQVNEIINKILRLKRQTPSIITSTSYLKRILKYKNNKVSKFLPNCLAGKTFCVLSPEGEVALCVGMFRKSFDGKKLGFYNAFKKLKYPGCDCNFRCYYNTSNLHSMKPFGLAKAAYNQLRGKWVHS